MPSTDPDPLGDGFKWRLRAELNRIRPPYSSPRYVSGARHHIGAWRLAPAALAVAFVGMLGLTAFAATGSPNPAVWTQQIVTRIDPSPVSSPSPVASDSPSPHVAAPAPPTQRAEPTPRTEPSQRPEGTPSPEHESGDGDHRASGAPTVSPNPYGGDR